MIDYKHANKLQQQFCELNFELFYSIPYQIFEQILNI